MLSERIHHEESRLRARNSFISPDIGIAEETRVHPGESVSVPILVTDEQKKHDDLLEKESHRETVISFTNGRSHIVQNGILIDLNGRISHSDSTLTITNCSPNTALFREGTKLGYTCHIKSEPIQGRALEFLVKNKDIFPGNNHWRYMGNGAENSNEYVGFEFFVGESQFVPKKRSEPVVFNGVSDSLHNRKFVDQNLEPLAHVSDERHFHVTELSPTLYLSNRVNMVITGVRTVADIFGAEATTVAAHAPSVLLKGGQTGKDWSAGNKIRLELFAPSGGVGKVASIQMLAFPV